MSLIDKVRTDRQDARASSATVAYGILTLLVGELETNASRNRSDITDEQVVQMCKKLIKSNNDTIKLLSNDEQVQKLVVENAMLTTYLPVEMTEAEITQVLVDAKCATIGESMAYMLNNFPGKYDRGLASKVAKMLL